MKSISKLRPVSGLAVLIFAAALAPRPALSFYAMVDCNLGGSIQNQLNAGATFIEVNGVCTEDISLQNDGTTILGQPPLSGDKIIGNVFIGGVQKVNINGMEIEGSTNIFDVGSAHFYQTRLDGATTLANGATGNFNQTTFTGPGNVIVANSSSATIGFSSIQNKDGDLAVNTGSFLQLNDTHISDLFGAFFVTTGSTASVFNATIEDTDNGMQVLRGSTLLVGNSTIGPANVDDASASCNPVCVGDNSEARFNDTSISGTNNDAGIGGAVSIYRQSSVRIRGNSSVTNNGSQPAVAAFHNSSVRQDKGSSPPADIVGGITALGSYVDFRNFRGVGDIYGDLNSVLRLRGSDPGNTSVVTGNITLNRDSALDLGSPAPVVNGDIHCIDKQSAASGTAGGIGKRKCKSF